MCVCVCVCVCIHTHIYICVWVCMCTPRALYMLTFLAGGRLVDLAGSERNFETQLMSSAQHRESANINASLMVLKNCLRVIAGPFPCFCARRLLTDTLTDTHTPTHTQQLPPHDCRP